MTMREILCAAIARRPPMAPRPPMPPRPWPVKAVLGSRMAEQVEAARQQLGTQLTGIAGNLEKQLQAEQSRLGGAVAASREKEFQQLTAQARQQLAETQALAQQKAQDYQLGLVAGYRRALQPVVAEIAGSKGAAVVLVADPTMLWFDAAVDITDEVIAEVRANPIAVPAAGTDPTGSPAAAAAGDPDTEKEEERLQARPSGRCRKGHKRL